MIEQDVEVLVKLSKSYDTVRFISKTSVKCSNMASTIFFSLVRLKQICPPFDQQIYFPVGRS